MARTPASMSEKPSAPRGRKPKTGGGTMSASEALKAAEAAIAPPPAKPAAKSSPVKVAAPKAASVAKVAPVKAAAKVPAPAPSVVKTAPAPAAKITSPSTPLPDGVLIAAATTAVDAAPEPPMPEAAITPEPSVPVSVTKTSPEPIIPQALPAPEPLPELLVEGTTMMNDVIETGKKFAEDTKAKLETVYAGLNEKAKVGVEKSTKALEEMSDMAKGNVEAIVESGKIAAKGMETFGQEAVDYSRKNFEKATASMKSLSSVKTPTEFFQLQSAFLSSTFDEFAKEAAKSSEAMMKLAGEVAQPITARVAVVTDKVKSLAA